MKGVTMSALSTGRLYSPGNIRGSHLLGWFYTSAENAAFETLAVKRFLYYLHSSVPTAPW
jgi:hypothetical protein